MTTETFISEISLTSTEKAQKAFERQERNFHKAIRDFYFPLIKKHRNFLERQFKSYSTLSPDKKEFVWDITRVNNSRLHQVIEQDLDKTLDVAETSISNQFDDELVDGFGTSYDYTLWELHQLGIDLTETRKPQQMWVKSLLLGSGVLGVSYLSRLRGWRGVFVDKLRKWLRVNTITEETLPETLKGYDAIASGFVSRVIGLGENELRRSYLLGNEVAKSPYVDKIEGSVWVTKGDGLVCPICTELNLTITNLRPIDDSHPGCRCRKVTIPKDFNGRPLPFADFLESIGRR